MRHPIRENMRVGVPITLEPGPDRISSPTQLEGFSRTGLRIGTPSGGKCRLLEAILAALEEREPRRARRLLVMGKPTLLWPAGAQL